MRDSTREPAGYISRITEDRLRNGGEIHCRIMPEPEWPWRIPLYLTPPQDREALAIRDAYVEGWKRGHNEGISCGHPLESCPKSHRDGIEAMDDWEVSEAHDAILATQEADDD